MGQHDAPIATPAASLRAELAPMVRLATPVVVAEVGWMAMGLVDTMMVGRVGPEAIGAVGLGNSVAWILVVGGMGMLLGLDPLVAQAHGAGRRRDAHGALVQGLWLAAAAAVVVAPLTAFAGTQLGRLGVAPAIRDAARDFLRVFALGLVPLSFFFALRRYAQAVGLAHVVTTAVLSANLINAAVGWVLVFGHFGLPALGATGTAWATVAARTWMLAWLVAGVGRHARRHDRRLFAAPRRPEMAMLARLMRLGAPAAVHLVLEVGAFSVAAMLAARFDAVSLAAHQLAIMAASFAFMFPLGISTAAAVRVGHAVGAGAPREAARAGWLAIGLGGAVMLASATLFVAAPRAVLGIFTADTAVIDLGVRLLALAAAFQLSDGLQVVAAGALRGLGETRVPMYAGLLGYWLLGLPTGWVLANRHGLGVVGIWIGLSLGVVVIAVVLVAMWARRAQERLRA